MLNKIHFVALHDLMHTMSYFAISSQACLAKFDASDAFDRFSCLNLQRPSSATNTAWFKHLKMAENIC